MPSDKSPSRYQLTSPPTEPRPGHRSRRSQRPHQRRSSSKATGHRHRRRASRRHRSLIPPSESSSSSPSDSSDYSSDSTSASSRSRSRTPHRKSRTHHKRHHKRHHHSQRHTHRSSRRLPGRHSRGGAPISKALQRKIVRGEFIEFTELLGELTVAGSANIKPRSRNRRPVAPIASLQSWLQAWSIFAEVLSAASPRVAPKLWRYQAFIVRSSQRFQPHAWLQYDLHFRRKLALDPSISWSSTDNELVASWLSADTLPPQLACYACGGSNHLASECPARQAGDSGSFAVSCNICKDSGHITKNCPHLATGFHQRTDSASTALSQPRPPPRKPRQIPSFPRSVQLPPSSTAGSAAPMAQPFLEPCILWNRNGSCKFGQRCTRRHNCLQCQGLHPMRDCPGQSR